MEKNQEEKLKNYIPINYEIFGELHKPETSMLHIIKPKGFVVLTYIRWKSKGSNFVPVTPDEIMTFMGIPKRNTREIISILSTLQTKTKYIKCDIDLSAIKKNQSVMLDITNYNRKQHQGIPEDIFLNNYKDILENGWTIFCFLAKLHNLEYGYADPSEKLISATTNIYIKNISITTKQLQKEKLIKIKPRELIQNGYNDYGEEVYKYTPKKYIVLFKTKFNYNKK